MAENDADRTEPATPKRREDARKKGDVARSRELQATLLMAVGFLALGSSLGMRVLEGVAGRSQALLAGSIVRPSTLADYHAVLLAELQWIGVLLLPFGLLLLVTGVLSGVVQVGIMFSWKAVSPQARRINPLSGLKRMVSVEQIFELGKSILKVALIGGLTAAVLVPATGLVLALVDAGAFEGLRVAGALSRNLVIAGLLALALLAAADVAWVRYRHEKKLKMTKQEVRDELKQREGDPRLRGRMREKQAELSRHRMLAAVADADVVITNPTHFAVAIRYDTLNMAAPQVVAKGRNHLAERIREQAREHDVPIVENPPLARGLYRDVKVGAEIPEALFRAVAEVLAYVYRLNPGRRDWTRSAA